MANTIPACYEVSVLNPSRIWQTDNVLKSELPILAFQIVFTVALSRLFFFIYKPLHQPRLISQISVSYLIMKNYCKSFSPIIPII